MTDAPFQPIALRLTRAIVACGSLSALVIGVLAGAWEHRTESARLHAALAPCADLLRLPSPRPEAEPSWFGYAIGVRPEAPFRRIELVRHLEARHGDGRHASIVVVAEGQKVCEHTRVIDRTHRSPGRTIYDWRHYLAVVQRKPGAMRNGAPFIELPDASVGVRHYSPQL